MPEGFARGIARAARERTAGIEPPSRSPQSRTGTPTGDLAFGEAALVPN